MVMRPSKAETAVHGCHCPGDMAVRMRKVLARLWVGVRVCHLHLLLWHKKSLINVVICFRPVSILRVRTYRLAFNWLFIHMLKVISVKTDTVLTCFYHSF